MEIYARTDLACEFVKKGEALPDGAELVRRELDDGISVERMSISREASEIIGRPCGDYVTFYCGKISELDEYVLDRLSYFIGKELISMSEKVTGKKLSGDLSVLVAGLGNKDMTPDAIGPLTVSGINATLHLADAAPEMFKAFGCCRVAAIAPGVLGQTGIETFELINGAVKSVRPDVVIAIDALAARSCDRLTSTIQLSDSGIQPGAGIGNRRTALSSETLGVPVIALGVPTVVDSSTLVKDALIMSGYKNTLPELDDLLKNGSGFFVAPKECDEIIKCICSIFSSAINTAFGITV